MKKRIFGSWLLWMICGALMIFYTLASAGISFLFPPRAAAAEEAEALCRETGFSRHFEEFRFDTVIFSGLYLCSGDDDTPTDWIMCGYFDGKFIPFYVSAASGDTPEDLTNVSYLLRRPTAANAMHSEWVVASLVDDIVDEGYYTTEQAEYFFTAAVLQADRNGAVQYLILALSGALLITLGLVFLVFHIHPDSPEPPDASMEEPPEDDPVDASAEEPDFGFTQVN